MGYFERAVSEYMNTPVHCVTDRTSLPEACRELETHGVSAAPVVTAQGSVIGILSRSDLLEIGVVRKGARWQRPILDLPDIPATDAMTRNPLCVAPSALLCEAVDAMLHERVRRLCVVAAQCLVGIFSLHDATRAVVDDRIPMPLAELMSGPVVTARAADPVARGLERLDTANIHTLIVTDGDFPIGVFGQSEALLAQRSTLPSRVEDWSNPRLLCLPASLPVHRAAAQAVALHAEHIVVLDGHALAGIVTPSDIARSGLSHERQDALRSRSHFR